MILGLVRSVFTDLSPGNAAGLDTGPTEWAVGSLRRSVRRAGLTAVGGWQLIMLFATFSSLGLGAWPLGLAQISLGLLSLSALARVVPDAFVSSAAMAVALWSMLASRDVDSTLVFATCWQINFASCVAALLIMRPYVVAMIIGETIAMAVAMMVALPEWPVQFALSTIVTQTSIVITVRMGLPFLHELARRADENAAAAQDATRRAELARHLSALIAEQTRVLHDTAINTLGAIASGTAGTGREQQVSDQCARDVALLTALRSEQPSQAEPELREIFDQPGLPIRRGGLDDEAVARVAGLLPVTVIGGVVGCVREAVTNATKHSGADAVEIDLAATDRLLTVVVRDHGVGFVGAVLDAGGVQASIRNRARDRGFRAEVSSTLGVGTTVALFIPLDLKDVPVRTHTEVGLESSVGSLYRRAGLLWGLGVTAVSVVLTLAGGANHFGALYPMIAVMLLAWVISWYDRGSRFRNLLAGLLIASTCATFLLSAAATNFGEDGAVHWQALAPTGPFVLLLSLRPSRSVLSLGVAAWTAVVTAIVLLTPMSQSATASQIVGIAGCVGLGFAAVWAAFQMVVARLLERASQLQQEIFGAQLSVELDAASQASYRRWLDAGLDSAIELLAQVADGSRSPWTTDTRDSCGAEEGYLRQLVLISPELVHLGRELMPTLGLARSRGVNYSLRVGSTDAPDEDVARRIGTAIRRNLAMRSAGQKLTATVFPVDGGLRLTLIGQALIPPPPVAEDEVRFEHLGTVDVLEMTSDTTSDQSIFSYAGGRK